MAADFTRFDFHAKKFYFSEDVQVMSAEEVGQYLLLLVAAWLGGKDSSLPDNPTLLARMARVPVVSELVLDKFPVVETEHGPRRRNETLYEEWAAAVKRSTQATKKANERWGNTTEEDPVLPQQYKSNAAPVPTVIPSPTQAKPPQAGFGSARPDSSHPKPAQPLFISQPKPDDLTDDRGAAAPDPAQEQHQEPDFKLFRRLWSNKKLDLGRDKDTVSRYKNACVTHGASTVHAAVDAWATTKTIDWMGSNNVRSPFGLFLSQLAKTIERMSDDKTVDLTMIEADSLAETIPPALTTKEAVADVDSVILQMAADEDRRRADRKVKFASTENTTTVDPASFLED